MSAGDVLVVSPARLRIADIARDCELNLVAAAVAERNGDHVLAAECRQGAAEDSAAAFALARVGGAK